MDEIKNERISAPANGKKKNGLSVGKIRGGLILLVLGYLLFLLGAKPAMFGMDRSPVVGFVQIAVFLIGLAFICLGGYQSLMSIWDGEETSISADIGMRLVATGYVMAVFSGMADVFGFGTHLLPGVPFFGIWQARGVEFSMGLISLGLILMIRLRPSAQRETQKISSEELLQMKLDQTAATQNEQSGS